MQLNITVDLANDDFWAYNHETLLTNEVTEAIRDGLGSLDFRDGEPTVLMVKLVKYGKFVGILAVDEDD